MNKDQIITWLVAGTMITFVFSVVGSSIIAPIFHDKPATCDETIRGRLNTNKRIAAERELIGIILRNVQLSPKDARTLADSERVFKLLPIKC